jgi:TetR/AcrR family transcriptional regulator
MSGLPALPAAATPRRRDAERSRGAILGAATAIFSAKGYEGARIEAIVQAAGVNTNLLYHYYGSKERLFIAVMEEAYLTIRAHHRELEIEHLGPVAAMAELVRATFRLFVRHPHIIGLLNAENLHQARHVAKSELIPSLYDPLFGSIARILERGARAGLFRAGVDPVELFITINGLGYFYLSNRYTLGVISHADLTAPDRLARREAHIVEVVLAYLQHRP